MADTHRRAAYEAATGAELSDAYELIQDCLGETLGEEIETITELTWRWAAIAPVLIAVAWALAMSWSRGCSDLRWSHAHPGRVGRMRPSSSLRYRGEVALEAGGAGLAPGSVVWATDAGLCDPGSVTRTTDIGFVTIRAHPGGHGS